MNWSNKLIRFNGLLDILKSIITHKKSYKEKRLRT